MTEAAGFQVEHYGVLLFAYIIHRYELVAGISLIARMYRAQGHLTPTAEGSR